MPMLPHTQTSSPTPLIPRPSVWSARTTSKVRDRHILAAEHSLPKLSFDVEVAAVRLINGGHQSAVIRLPPVWLLGNGSYL